METGSAVGWLFGMTITVVLVVLLFMLYRARRSQAKRGEAPGEVKVGEAKVGDRHS